MSCISVTKTSAILLFINLLLHFVAYLGKGAPDPFLFAGTKLTIVQAVGVVACIIQILVFVPSYIYQTEKFFDLTGASTFFICTIYSLFGGAEVNKYVYSARAVLISLCVIIWCSRLGFFLFTRMLKEGKDGRFDEIKPDFGRFLTVWFMQALWVVLTAFPAFVVNADQDIEKLRLVGTDILGFFIWLVGFVFEVVADHQKRKWSEVKDKRNPFIDVGLWKFSRHPNYFGEMIIWVGVYVMSYESLDGTQLVAPVSPIFVFLLLAFVSGIPLLEKRADEKFGDLPEYKRYKKNTSVLVPLPVGWGKFINLDFLKKDTEARSA